MRPWLITFAPLCGLFVNVVAEIITAHRSRRIGRSIVAGAVAGFITTIVVAGSASSAEAIGGVDGMLIDALTYLALAFGFWTFLNLNITSLRIRLIREILNADGGLSRTELLSRYSAEEFLRRRLERLTLSGQMTYVEGRWHLKAGTYLLLARAIRLARTIIMPAQRGG